MGCVFATQYIAMVEDMVVGVVIEKHPESYRIDINSTQVWGAAEGE
jgi:exosome complex RNA-binding protein Rrp4